MRRTSRFVFLAAFVLGPACFVACGDDTSSSTPPDDGSETGTPGLPDGGGGKDQASPDKDSGGTDGGSDGSAMDAPVDTGTDTGPKDGGLDADTGVDAGPTTRLYFGGDFNVNNTSSVGRALVPATATTPATAVIVPKAAAYALSADGTTLVFAADITVAGRADLYVANSDGTNATLRYALPANTASIVQLQISPDGTRIAFMADSELDGQQDVYVLPLAGATPPVRVSPARAANNVDLDAQSFSWSRDSSHLAVAGDFTTNGKNELWVADVANATPAVAALGVANIPDVAMGSIGISTGLRPIWTAGGKVCAKANLDATTATFRLYCANADASGFAEPANFPALPAQLGTYGLSPDGQKLAFSADSAAAPGAYEVFTMPSDDSAAATMISAGNTTALATTNRGPNFSIPLKWSPDATMIAYVSDKLVDDRNELFVLPAAGGVAEKRIALVGVATDAARDVTALVWAPDSSAVAFIADQKADNDFELFRVLNVTTADQTPALVRGVPASGDMDTGFELEWRP